MSSAVEFMLSLIDKVSGPASAAASSLGHTATALDKIKGSTTAADKVIGNAGGSLGDLGKGGTEATSGLGGVVESLGGMGRVGGIASAAVAAVGAALVYAGTKAAMFAAEMQNFREDTEFALAATLGTADKAHGVFELSRGIANQIGGDISQVATQMTEFMRVGMSSKGAEDLVKTFADLAAINPGANIETFSAKVRMMQADGFASMRFVKELERSGINKKSFLTNIAGQTGKTVAGAEAALKAGTITADVATKALEATVFDLGGKKGLGSVAEKFATTTITGRLQALRGQVSNLFLGLETGPASEAIGRMIGMLTDLLDPSTTGGRATLEVLQMLADAANDLTSAISNPDEIGSFLTTMTFGLKAVLPLLKALGGGFFTGLGAAIGPIASGIMTMVEAISGTSGSTETLQLLGQAIGFTVAAIAIGVAAVGVALALLPVLAYSIVEPWIGALSALTSAFDSIVSGAREAGTNIIHGLAEGITAGTDMLKSVVEGMGESIVSTLKRVLKIASPSKVMESLGGYTAEGFAIGIDGGIGGVRSSAQSMAAEPTNVSPGGGGGRSGGSYSMTANITVNSGASSDSAQLVAETVRAEISRFWEEISISTGALAPV